MFLNLFLSCFVAGLPKGLTGSVKAGVPLSMDGEGSIIDSSLKYPLASFNSQFNTSFSALANSFDTCPKISSRLQPPTDVWDLRADDFGLIIGMGDSLAAGLYASIPFDSRWTDSTWRNKQFAGENRGVSFIAGGDPGTFSLAHAIRQYNPNLKGPICPADTIFQPLNESVLGLNVALSGSWTTRGNMDHQLNYLEKQLPLFQTSGPEPWKLLVIEVGFNNICLSCYGVLDYFALSPDDYESDIRYFLQELQKKFSKLFVVLTSPALMSKLQTVIETNAQCPQLRQLAGGCFCLDSPSADRFKTMDQMALDYADRAKKVVAEFQFKQDPYFGVVYDKGLHELNNEGAQADKVLNGYDCFHPNAVSHARMGAGIWNNLFVPDTNKTAWEAVNKPELKCLNAEHRVWYPRH